MLRIDGKQKKQNIIENESPVSRVLEKETNEIA
jgi:hypothetical protein